MLRLVYFAWVRERIGVEGETLAIDAPMRASAIVPQLIARSDGHAAALADLSRLRLAVNEDMAGWDTLLAPGDELAIFPPMTGG